MAPFVLSTLLGAQLRSDHGLRLEGRDGGATAVVMVDGQRLTEVGLVRENRVQVPMRPIFERLGATVQWFATTRSVVATANGKTITLIVGENVANKPERVVLDFPPRIVDGRIMVPLRFVSESLGARVHWDAEARTAHVNAAEDR